MYYFSSTFSSCHFIIIINITIYISDVETKQEHAKMFVFYAKMFVFYANPDRPGPGGDACSTPQVNYKFTSHARTQ